MLDTWASFIGIMFYMKTYSYRKLAKEAGVSVSLVKYYAKRGVLKKKPLVSYGFDEEALEFLKTRKQDKVIPTVS